MVNNPYQSPSDAGSYDSPYNFGAHKPLQRGKFRPSIGEVAFLVTLAIASLVADWYDIWFTNAEKIYTASLCIALVACAISSTRTANNLSIRVPAYVIGVGATVAVAILICWRLMVTGQPPNPYIILGSVAAGMIATRIGDILLPSRAR